MPIVDVHRVLEDRRPLHEVDFLPVVDLGLQVIEVALHLRHEPFPPPVGEVGAVGRQHRIEVGADLLGIGGIVLWDAG